MFTKALPVILKFEGGYVNNPNDPGGATNKGITQKVYDSHRKSLGLPAHTVKFISDSEVESIYQHYWRQSRAEKISETHPLTALVHFDFAVNAGFKQAAKTLQRALGLELVDGIIGRSTLASVSVANDYELAKIYCEERFEFYYKLVELRPKLKEFLRGWLWRVKHLRGIVDDWAKRSQPKDSVSGIA